jgi:uncharacterized protein
MATLKVQTGTIPLPNPKPVSRPYWDGCLVGELRFQRCADCGYAQFNPGYLCGSCHGRNLGWEVGSGRGTLYSWTVVWRPQTPAFEVPYAPAVVELEEGYWMLSAVVDCEPEDLREGMPLVVLFQPMSDEIALPYFRPVAAPG